MNAYVLSVATLISIYAILAVSLSFLIGHLGIFSLAHAALFGVGGYAAAILTVKMGWPFLPSLIAAVFFTGLAGAILAIPSLRVSGDYFIMASFALQIVFESIFANWTEVTGGTGGIPGVLRPAIGRLDFSSDEAFLVLTSSVAILVILVSVWLVRSPYGRMLHVIRDDEVVAAILGKAVRSTKVMVTVFSGALAGLAGVFFGEYLMYLSPDSFGVATSISIITMVVMGGMTSVVGSAVGAVVIVLLPQFLQQIDLAQSIAGPLEQVLFGLLLIILMYVRPQGLFGQSLRTKGPRRPPVSTELDKSDAEVVTDA